MQQSISLRIWFKRFVMLVTLAVSITGAAITHAQTAALLPATALLPEGQTLITLTVTERTKVTQDVLLASLRIEVENLDQNVVQNTINTAMQQALDRARVVTGVEVSSGHYSVYQMNRQTVGGRPDLVWRGSQSINLQGKAAASLLALAGELQAAGFVMSQLSYQLSTERADEIRDALMESAIVRAREKAQRATVALGRSSFEIASMDVDSSSNFAPPMMMRAGSMAADTIEMAAPVAQAGETEVMLSIRVQVVAK